MENTVESIELYMIEERQRTNLTTEKFIYFINPKTYFWEGGPKNFHYNTFFHKHEEEYLTINGYYVEIFSNWNLWCRVTAILVFCNRWNKSKKMSQNRNTAINLFHFLDIFLLCVHKSCSDKLFLSLVYHTLRTLIMVITWNTENFLQENKIHINRNFDRCNHSDSNKLGFTVML